MIQYPIGNMRSHVDDCTPEGETIFSRDRPDFEVTTQAGNRLIVMVNHLKTKAMAARPRPTRSARPRRRASPKSIKALIDQGIEHIAVIGDFNDTPDSEPLRPLLDNTTLKDIFEHPTFDKGGHPGTYGACNASNKID